ncbi:acyl-CoA dehydrogenase family protein [Paenibacillus puerhi]|uniref:acyl-CoA dehydrogenase family protein n=1 Tax=Paenibacillus puerhi TaxID=2692622 RepID=UPI00135BF944|nr:acyl-CoA dehydrogenase family protein [Paenibacillus puerhi]
MIKNTCSLHEELIESAREAAKIISGYANEVDEYALFPINSLNELKKRKLLSILVSKEDGGGGATLETVSRIAQIISSSCLNTGVIWSMHCQQVAILMKHLYGAHRQELLHRLVSEQLYIASITTEKGKGGNIFSSISPLTKLGDEWLLQRTAPIVTGGQYGDLFLIYMNGNSSDHSAHDVVIALVERSNAKLTYTTNWNSMGMRGTGSVGMEIEASIEDHQIIKSEKGFKEIALQTVVPIGHISLSASWLGAAKGVFEKLIAIMRKPVNRTKFNMNSDMLFEKLGRIRLKLDVVDNYLKEMIRQYDNASSDENLFQTNHFSIQINNLKIVASEMLYEAVDEMINLAGVTYGYTKNDAIPLERTLRDIKSARLMYRNDLLLITNGKLSLFEKRLLY